VTKFVRISPFVDTRRFLSALKLPAALLALKDGLFSRERYLGPDGRIMAAYEISFHSAAVIAERQVILLLTVVSRELHLPALDGTGNFSAGLVRHIIKLSHDAADELPRSGDGSRSLL
jgi:hypothetical protein